MSAYEIAVLNKLEAVKDFLEEFTECLVVAHTYPSQKLLIDILLRNNINFKKFANFPTQTGYPSKTSNGWLIVFGKTRALFTASEVSFWDADDETDKTIFKSSFEDLIKLKTFITQNLWQKSDILLIQDRY